MSSGKYVELTTEFTFEAAHYFAHFPEGHLNRRIHGHSFRAELVVGGTPDEVTGFVCEYTSLDRAVAMIREQLDHQILNEITGLHAPSLENLAIWIWEHVTTAVANVQRVTVFRDSCRQASTYYGPNLSSAASRILL